MRVPENIHIPVIILAAALSVLLSSYVPQGLVKAVIDTGYNGTIPILDGDCTYVVHGERALISCPGVNQRVIPLPTVRGDIRLLPLILNILWESTIVPGMNFIFLSFVVVENVAILLFSKGRTAPFNNGLVALGSLLFLIISGILNWLGVISLLLFLEIVMVLASIIYASSMLSDIVESEINVTLSPKTEIITGASMGIAILWLHFSQMYPSLFFVVGGIALPVSALILVQWYGPERREDYNLSILLVIVSMSALLLFFHPVSLIATDIACAGTIGNVLWDMHVKRGPLGSV